MYSMSHLSLSITVATSCSAEAAISRGIAEVEASWPKQCGSGLVPSRPVQQRRTPPACSAAWRPPLTGGDGDGAVLLSQAEVRDARGVGEGDVEGDLRCSLHVLHDRRLSHGADRRLP